MDEKIPKFLRREGSSLLFNGDGEFIFYVPETLFDRNDVFIAGEYVNAIGIFDYAVFDKNGNSSGIKPFFFPSVFLCKPSTIEKVKNAKIKEGLEAQDYRLLRFNDGDAVVADTKVPQDNENIECFFKTFLWGKLPTSIPYDKLQNYFVENIALNGNSYGISLQMFGFVISEMCRSRNDLTTAYRNTKFKDMTSYKTISIVDLPKYLSPNNAISSSNWDNSVVGAIMHPADDVNSPMEKLIMG